MSLTSFDSAYPWRFFVAGRYPTPGMIAELTAARSRKVTFNLFAPAQFSFTIDGRLQQTLQLQELTTDLAGYRWNGSVYAPLFRGTINQSSDTISETTHAVNMQCVDYAAMFNRRFLGRPYKRGYPTPVEQATIIQELIDQANAAPASGAITWPADPNHNWDTGVVWGGVKNPSGVPIASTGINRQRYYATGAYIGTLIDEMSRVINGFDYAFVPYDASGGAAPAGMMLSEMSAESADALSPDAPEISLNFIPPPPYITSITPNFVPTAGGTVVRLDGGNLAWTDTLNFDGVNYSWVSSPPPWVLERTMDHLTIVAPAHAAGPVNIYVTSVFAVNPSVPPYSNTVVLNYVAPPVTANANTIGDLRIWYPQRGTTRDFIAEYGVNVASVTRTVQTTEFLNAMVAIGGEDPAGVADTDTGAKPSLVAGILDADFSVTPIMPERAWGASVSFSNVTTLSTLQENAAGEFLYRNQVVPVYTLKFVAGAYNLTDFWLGDSIRIRIQSGRLNVDTVLRVLTIEFAIDDNGIETVTVTVGRQVFSVTDAMRKTERRVQRLENR